ncbi:MAG: DUF1189 family protein [Eubacterium sp.]|nr:DUF1189 family protein [Eubacterium sp.]
MKIYDDEEQKRKDEEDRRLIEEYQRKKEEMDRAEELKEAELRKNHGRGEDDSPYGLGFEVSKDMGFLDQFLTSLIKPKKLLGLAQLSAGKFIKYLVVMALFLSFMTYVVPVAATITGFKGFNHLFKESMPQFKAENDTLTADDKFKLNLSGFTVVMDTSEPTVDVKKLDGSGLYITIGSKNIEMILLQSGMSQKIYTYPVGVIFYNGVTNDTFVEAIPEIYMVLGFSFLFMAVLNILKYLIWAFIYSIFAWALVKRTDLHLDYWDAFRLAFYAGTWGMILPNVNMALGYIIPPILIFIAGIFISLRFISISASPYVRNEIQD